MRASFGAALLAAGGNHDDLFVMDADCSTSTKTDAFAVAYPQRFVNVGIAEQNMVGAAAGLSLVGYRVVVNAFAAMLVHRAHEQLMQSVGITAARVLVAGHYAGLSAGEEGAPHHAISDVALMRAVPHMEVWWPSDDAQVSALVPRLLDGLSGPVYLRLERNPTARIEGGFKAADGALRVWDVPDPIACIVASGGIVRACREAARSVPGMRVVSVERVSPFPAAEVAAALGTLQRVVCIEEHGPVGGLAAALWEAGSLTGRTLERVTIPGFTETGSQAALKARYGLDVPGLITAARRAVETTPRAATSLAHGSA